MPRYRHLSIYLLYAELLSEVMSSTKQCCCGCTGCCIKGRSGYTLHKEVNISALYGVCGVRAFVFVCMCG